MAAGVMEKIYVRERRSHWRRNRPLAEASQGHIYHPLRYTNDLTGTKRRPDRYALQTVNGIGVIGK
jgi:hypothetical protein